MLKLVEEDLEIYPFSLQSFPPPPTIASKVSEINFAQADEKQCHSISSFLWFPAQQGYNNTGQVQESGRLRNHHEALGAAAQSPAGATERGQDMLGRLPVAWAWLVACAVRCWPCRRAGLTPRWGGRLAPHGTPALSPHWFWRGSSRVGSAPTQGSAQGRLLCRSIPCPVTLVRLGSYSDNHPLL